MRVSVRVLGAVGVAAALVGGLAVPSPTGSQRDVAVSFARLDAATPAAVSDPVWGLRPADIASAYGITGTGPGTVGVVVAYDAPTLEADLAVYRDRFGLPPCTTANGCFRKVGQDGGSALPVADEGWAQEASLDVDAVSAACPSCSILVVEANGAYMSDLGAAVNTAVRLGAQAVSASWGAPESRNSAFYQAQYFDHPGVPVVAASGDSGYQAAASMPANLPNVIAVGGTRLSASSGLSPARGGEHTLVSPDAVVPTANAAALKRAVAKALALAKAVAKQRRLVTARTRVVHRHPSAATRHRLAAARKDLKTLRTRHTKATSTVRALRDALAAGGSGTTPPVVTPPVVTPTPTPTPTPTVTPTQAPSAPPASTSSPAFPAARTTWTERAWTGGGSGCSSYIAKPAWQTDTMCSGRSVVDIAAVGDPNTGLAVYDTYTTSASPQSGWMVAGGTSLSAPLIAAMLVGSGRAANYSTPAALYTRPEAFWDVATGSNGSCAAAICTAGAGVDGPTGVGTPKSLASF